jgi:hypothetical protein
MEFAGRSCLRDHGFLLFRLAFAGKARPPLAAEGQTGVHLACAWFPSGIPPEFLDEKECLWQRAVGRTLKSWQPRF